MIPDTVKIDQEDRERLSHLNWFIDSKGYVYRHRQMDGRDRPVRMHREIMCAPAEMEVDHINGDKLDNRRKNLRLCTRQQNLWNTRSRHTNTSGFKGVDFRPQKNKFRARIRIGHRRLFLGYFNNAADAGEAYNKAAELHHGEFKR